MVSLTGSVTDITPAFIQESLQRLEEGAAAIEKATQKVESALNDFAIKLQEIHPDLPNVETAFEEAVADSEQAIANAFEYVTILHARIKGFKAYIERSQDDTTTNKWSDTSSMQTAIIKNLELPTIPIPTFNGDIWEWDNFWELFNTNIHS
ncbi:unnamed protein product [Angiostrongylus costaricensis]|uniref:LXG domain-containing protein n=1 Tax=Angiostrongylus costaricensis TaxID=334426 RepID=A0A0R3Q223_ANGCS|nr:unnamed protein product [Angiostrongylus costaricensis]